MKNIIIVDVVAAEQCQARTYALSRTINNCLILTSIKTADFHLNSDFEQLMRSVVFHDSRLSTLLILSCVNLDSADLIFSTSLSGKNYF